MQRFFYELHEGATDLMTDALLVSDRDHTPAQFAAMVEAARAAVLETFEEDTLVEAIARELERVARLHVHQRREAAGVDERRDVEDEDNYLVEQSDEFRSIVAELERS